MSAKDAVKAGLARYFDFRSRAGRSEFWWFFLFCTLAPLAASLADFVLFRLTGSQHFNPVSVSDWGWTPDTGQITAYNLGVGLLASLTWWALVIPWLAIGARRLHDIGRSGWWQLLWLVPLVGQFLLLVWHCRRGEPEPNRFGAPPVTE
jgi:uncharacterized membrane protein YhaH (DUF805 family)